MISFVSLAKSKYNVKIADSDARDYIRRVEIADKAFLPKHVKTAIQNLITTLKSTESPVEGVSNWEAIKSSCLLAGPKTLAGAIIPLKGPSPTNFNFVEGDYNPTTGLKANGSNKVLGTNYTNVGSDIDIHASVYSTTDFTVSANATNYIANDPGVSNQGLTRIIKIDDSTTSFRVIDWSGINNVSNPSPPNNFGFLGCSTIPGSLTQIAYSNRTTNGIGSRNASFTPYNSPFYVFGNPTANFSSARLSFYSVGKAIDLGVLRVAIEHYMEEIARGDEAFDPDAWEYIKAVEMADKAILPTHIRAAKNDFIIQCKADESVVAGRSNWDSLRASCLMAGASTLAGALVPLRGPAPTNINFVEGDYNPTTGLKGNGGKWLDSGYRYQDDLDLHVSDMHTAVYSTEAGNEWFLGQSTNWCMYRHPGTPHRIGFRAGLPTDFYDVELSDTSTGFVGVARSPDLPEAALYRFPSDDGSIVTATPTNITAQQYFLVFARSSGETKFTGRIGFYSVGHSVDLAKLKTALDTYMGAIATP